jgi:hypothetical protein
VTPGGIGQGVLDAVPFLAFAAAVAVVVLRTRLPAPDPVVRSATIAGLAAATVHAAVLRPWIGNSFESRGTQAGYARFEQVVVAVALVAVTALTARVLRAERAAIARRRLALLVAFAVAAVPRLLFPADLLHSEQFGIRLLSDVAAFPDPAVFRFSWGQTSFVVLGVAMRLAGSYHAVFVTNALAAGLTAVLWAVLVHRWTASRWAAGATVLAIALHPGLLRIAASEDPHNLGLLFFSAALVAIDVYLGAPDRRRDAALLAALALVLAAWSRQTLLLILPMAALASIGRGGWRVLLRREVLAAAALVAGAVTTHALATGRSDALSLAVMARFAPKLAAAFFDEPSPLVDPFVTPLPVALLALVGIAAPGVRPGRVPAAVGIVLAWGLTGVFRFGDAGVRLLFRTPLLLVATASAGLGVGVVERCLAARRPRLFRGVLAATALMYVASAAPGMARWARRDPLGQELSFLSRAVRELPAGAIITVPRYEDFPTGREPEEPKPEWIFPAFLLDGREVHLASGDETATGRCTVFYRGLLCHTLGLGEASPGFRALWRDRGRGDAGEFQVRLVDALVDLEVHPIAVSPEAARRARAACFERPETEPLPGLVTRLVLPRQPYVTNVIYAAESMEVGFFVARGSACAARIADRRLP